MRVEKISLDRLMIPNQTTLNQAWGSEKQRYWGLLTAIGIKIAISKYQKQQLTSMQNIYWFLIQYRTLVASVLDHDPTIGKLRKTYAEDRVSREEHNRFNDQVNTFEKFYNERESETIKISASGYQGNTKDCALTTVTKGSGKESSYQIYHSSPTVKRINAISAYANKLLDQIKRNEPSIALHKNIIYVTYFFAQLMPLKRGSASTTQMAYHILECLAFGKFTYFNYKPADKEVGGASLVYDLAAMVAKDFNTFHDYFKKDVLDESIVVEDLNLNDLKQEFELKEPVSIETLKNQIKSILEELGKFQNEESVYFKRCWGMNDKISNMIASWKFLSELIDQSGKDDLVLLQVVMRIFMVKFSEHKFFYPLFSLSHKEKLPFWVSSKNACSQYDDAIFDYEYKKLHDLIELIKNSSSKLNEDENLSLGIQDNSGHLLSLLSHFHTHKLPRSAMINAMQYFIDQIRGDYFHESIKQFFNFLEKITVDRPVFFTLEEFQTICEDMLPMKEYIPENNDESVRNLYKKSYKKNLNFFYQKFSDRVKRDDIKETLKKSEPFFEIILGEKFSQPKVKNQPSITTLSLLNTKIEADLPKEKEGEKTTTTTSTCG